MAALAYLGFLRGGLLALGYDAAEFFFGSDGSLFDVGGAECPQIISGLESVSPGGPVHVRQGLHVWRG